MLFLKETFSNKVSNNIFVPEVYEITISAEMYEPALRINELSPEEEYNVDMVEYISHVLTYGRFFTRFSIIFSTFPNVIFERRIIWFQNDILWMNCLFILYFLRSSSHLPLPAATRICCTCSMLWFICDMCFLYIFYCLNLYV